MIVPPAVDLVTATAFGVILVLLLALVHFAGRAHGAAVFPGVIRSQIRHWLMTAAAGGVAAVGLTICGTALRLGLPGAIPSVVVVAMLGALVTVAGAIALVTSREDPSTTAAE